MLEGGIKMIDEKEIKALGKYQFWKGVFKQDKLESRDKDNCTACSGCTSSCSGCKGCYSCSGSPGIVLIQD